MLKVDPDRPDIITFNYADLYAQWFKGEFHILTEAQYNKLQKEHKNKKCGWKKTKNNLWWKK